MQNQTYKLLLVEDDELDRMAFMRMVKNEQLPYDCIHANSVEQARTTLNDECFDVVISDYWLGDGTALDVLALVKDAPVIIVTGAGDEEVAIKAWRTGAYDYLVKDIERNYLKTVPITIENAVKYKKAQERLRLLSAAVMSTKDSVYITDVQGRIIFINDAFCQTYGYQEQEILGKNSDIIHRQSPPSQDTNDAYTFDETDIWSYHARKDGSQFPVSISNSVIKDENGNEVAFVGVARDISERVLAEDKIRSINLKLTEGIRQLS